MQQLTRTFAESEKKGYFDAIKNFFVSIFSDAEKVDKPVYIIKCRHCGKELGKSYAAS